MFYFIAIVIIVLALGFAWKKSREADSAARALDDLPEMVKEILRSITRAHQREQRPDVQAAQGWPGNVDCADINGDGRKEILVQYPTGAHGSVLTVLAWRNSRFEQLAYVSSGTPYGFEFGDFDGDGKIEIRTQETDWGAGLPYATAPRLVLLLRWSGTAFAEVSRKEISSDKGQ